jgi:hypothetical protein
VERLCFPKEFAKSRRQPVKPSQLSKIIAYMFLGWIAFNIVGFCLFVYPYQAIGAVLMNWAVQVQLPLFIALLVVAFVQGGVQAAGRLYRLRQELNEPVNESPSPQRTPWSKVAPLNTDRFGEAQPSAPND